MSIKELKNKDFLTPKELEREFGISTNKQYKMRMRKHYNQENSIPFIKLGKTILYRRSDIESWLNKNTINKRFEYEQ